MRPLHGHHMAFVHDSFANNAIKLRGGSDESESQADEKLDEVILDEVSSPTSNHDDTKQGWFTNKLETPTSEEPNKKTADENYVGFTMNSNGETTNIELQAPALQNELNKTLNSLNELRSKIKDEDHALVTANGVANGGDASVHISNKFPISREELPHFACMSVLMFLFIYVFTTGEF